uniref:Uncharacterized protein n=1 Tax=Arcella intermedia TaxID=1963864 RepID=A0A6B2LEY9_9EUKA
MEVGKETQTCNTHVCPIDCIWNQWSNWDQCIPCGWISRNRTYIPPVGTGQPCDLTSATEKKECLLLHIACLQAPPVIFSLNGSFTDTESLINLIARVLGIDKSYINVYVTPNETNPGTVNVMCSFSGSSNGVPLSTTQQNILAQNFSHSIVTNPEISNFFSSRKMLPTSLTDSSLQNYGVGYGVPNSNSQGTTPSDSSIPFWVWIIIGVAGLLLVVVIVLLILRSKATSEIV